MIGCKPLTDDEVQTLEQSLKTPRDKALFVLSLYTGFRIQEALSLKVKDVTSHGRVTVRRTNMKGRVRSRSVVLHPRVAEAVAVLVQAEGLSAEDFLFQSRKGSNVPITRMHAWRIIKDIVREHGLDDRIALHSTRKTFANNMYQTFDGNIFKTAKALGHKSVDSTMSYLSFQTEEIDAAIQGMK